jgi:hypothetical protein
LIEYKGRFERPFFSWFCYVSRVFVRASEFKVTVPALLFDPSFLVFDFAPQQGLTKFLVVEEATLALSPFIDIRFEPLAQGQFWVRTSELFALEGRHDIARPQPAFIFHHAFVCSTLLARCLNQIDAFFSLKEPWIFRRLADVKRARDAAVPGDRWRETFTKYTRLLCRNFRSGKTPVIKATNVANNLLADVLEFLPERPVLYLYSDLESFLISNLRKTDDTKQKIPALAQSFLRDGDFARRFPQMSDPSQLTFVQACGLIWLVNLYDFMGTMGRLKGAAVRSLDVRDFLDDLPGTLEALSRFFGHTPDAAEIGRMTDPAVLESNAKDPSSPYSPAQRRADLTEIGRRYSRELAQVQAWIGPAAGELGVMEFLRTLRLAG